MKIRSAYLYLIVIIGLFSSCSVVEKSSRHGFESGYYKIQADQVKNEKIYMDITDDQVSAYQLTGDKPGEVMMKIPLGPSDSIHKYSATFIKKSLDIDITTILLKFRPVVEDLPPQLTADFNAALYFGWRRDKYQVRGKVDPLGKFNYEVIGRGYDFGVFGGPATTTIGPFSTQNAVIDEYAGMILQFGVASFLESQVASFGIAIGFDYLLSNDRQNWIYNNRPWVGFIIGLALN